MDSPTSQHPCIFAAVPPPSHHPSVVIICVKRGPVNRPRSPRSSLVPRHPLTAALSIYGSTAMVPDEPYRAKGLCRVGNFPPHTLHLRRRPPCSSPQRFDSSLQFWGYLRKIDIARLLQPRKLGFRYSSSSILLDNPQDKARFQNIKVARLLPHSSVHCPRRSAALAITLDEGESLTPPGDLEVMYSSIHH